MTNDLPKSMTVIEATEAGGPEVLKPSIRPVPQLRASEVLVKVEATGVNGPDLWQRRGSYPPPMGVRLPS